MLRLQQQTVEIFDTLSNVSVHVYCLMYRADTTGWKILSKRWTHFIASPQCTMDNGASDPKTLTFIKEGRVAFCS